LLPKQCFTSLNVSHTAALAVHYSTQQILSVCPVQIVYKPAFSAYCPHFGGQNSTLSYECAGVQ